MERERFVTHSDECVCVCHEQNPPAMHVRACCNVCPHCHRNIKMDFGIFERHESQCVRVTIVDSDPTRNPGGVTLISEEEVTIIVPSPFQCLP